VRISRANRLCVDEKVFSEGAYADSHEEGAVTFDEEDRDLVRGRASLSRMPEMPLRGHRKPVFGDSAMARMPEVRTYVVQSHALRPRGSLQVTPRGRAVTSQANGATDMALKVRSLGNEALNDLFVVFRDLPFANHQVLLLGRDLPRAPRLSNLPNDPALNAGVIRIAPGQRIARKRRRRSEK